MNTPISVIVPLYNGVEYLETALKSIQAQIYPYWTCVVGVNGHGEDGGLVFTLAKQIIDSLNDARFSVVNLPHIRGAPQAINWMVRRATTEWIAHLDADDTWHPMKLHCQMNTLLTNNMELDILGTWCEYFGDASGRPAIPPLQIGRDMFERMNPMIHSSILIRKEMAVYTDEFVCYDYDCWCRNLLKGARFYNVPLALTFHRLYKNSAFNASGQQKPEAVRLKYFNHT
jgi:glycosyltransferase involved in cell wall biosynthesis